MQYNGQYENYNNPKLNVVQDQNIKTVIGSEIEKKVPLIKETFVPLNPIANQPTFGCLKFPFFQVFLKSGFTTVGDQKPKTKYEELFVFETGYYFYLFVIG